MNIGIDSSFSVLLQRSVVVCLSLLLLGFNSAFAAEDPAATESTQMAEPVLAAESMQVTESEDPTPTTESMQIAEPAEAAPAADISAEDQPPPAKPTANKNDQLIGQPEFVEPKVQRSEIVDARIDSENFELGIYAGSYTTEDFGSNLVYGVRLAYHVNEYVFFEAAGGLTETQRTSAEKILNRDFIPDDERTLTYYNVAIGFNALPSETFFGPNWAFHSAIYVIGGAGFTDFAGDTFFTINAGVGYRFLVNDWLALHLDYRNHIFEMDLLGEKKTTQNIEVHSGITIFF